MRNLFGALALFCSFTGATFAQRGAASPAPQREVGEREPLRRSAVSVYYDDRAVPHVYGESDEAAFYGVGFTQMRDYPVSTLLNLLSGTGRYAEVVGSFALGQDREIRHWEVPAIAAEQAAVLEPDVRALLQAYADGVEAGRRWWIEHPAALDALVDEVDVGGGQLETAMHLDPLPRFLNEAYGATDVRKKLELLLDRDAAYSDGSKVRIRLENVLQLGILVNSGVGGPGLYGGTGLTGTATNAWMAAMPDGADVRVLVMSDSHTPVNELGFAKGFYDVQGSSYRAAGWLIPGFPTVFYGYNDDLAWIVSAMPQQVPQKSFTDPTITAPDLPLVLGGGRPVVQNEWHATLEAGSSTSFLYEGAPVSLENESAQLYYRDYTGPAPTLVADPAGPTDFYWAPADGVSPYARRYPVTSPRYELPDPGAEIVFEQAYYAHEPRNVWEFFIGLGRARDAGPDLDEVLSKVLYNFGKGHSFLFADATGRLRYFWMCRVPEQGAGAVADAPWNDPDPAMHFLDGSRADHRWTGLHPYTDLPQLDVQVTPGGTPELFVNCNSTPDRVDAAGSIDLSGYPDYIVEHGNGFETFRHVRARQLLEAAVTAGTLTREASESAGGDQRDMWIATLWPLFREAATTTFDPDVAAFVAYVDAYKDDVEFVITPGDGGGEDFVAHRTSRVLPYTTLLQARYEREILQTPGLTAAQLGLGFDPSAAVPDPIDFGMPAWQPNVDAMVLALEEVAAVHAAGDGAGGLGNPAIVLDANASLTGPDVLTPTPWAHPRYEDAGVTVWGHVNVLPLTPHAQRAAFAPESLPPFPDPQFLFFRNLFNLAFYSAILPAELPSLEGMGVLPPSVDGSHRGFVAQRPAVYPIGGSGNGRSLFATGHTGYANDFEGMQPFGAGDSFVYYRPHTGGSSALFSVDFDGGSRKGRFLSAVGSTSLTRAIPENGNGDLDRFTPTADYVERVWSDLDTDPAYHAANSQLRHSLVYAHR